MSITLNLFKYKKWADLRTLNCVRLIDRAGMLESFDFARQQLNHMIIVEELFRSRLEKTSQPHCSTNTQTVPGLSELEDRLMSSCEWFLNYVLSCSETHYQEIVSFTFADGKHGAMSVAEILFHIVNHGSYHRGSIARALDQAGVPHPPDGYGIFIHEYQPQRRETGK